MNRFYVYALLGLGALAGCSGKGGGGAVAEQKAEEAAGAATMPTQKERSYPIVAAIANLTPGTPGRILGEISGAKNLEGQTVDLAASASAADTLIFNAEASSDAVLEQVNALLKQRKQVIVDSSGTPEGRKAVKAALEKMLGGASIEADGAMVTYYNDKGYGLTPLDSAPPGEGAAAGPNGVGNRARNVLGLD